MSATSAPPPAASDRIDPEALIRDMFRVIDSGRHDSLGAFFAADVCYERPGYPPIQGLDALLTFYRHDRVIAQGEHHIASILVSNGAAVCEGVFEGILKDGRKVTEAFADCYRLDGDRIRHRRTYFARPAI
jgi:ketosteroid isomerase-like protein